MLGKAKPVKIIRLTSGGHAAFEASQSAAHNLVCQAVSNGYFAYCEPDKVVVSNIHELRSRRLEKVVIYAPVAGG